MRADHAAELLEQAVRIHVAELPNGCAMAVDPAPEGRERHFPAWRHLDGLKEFTVAEELDFLLRVFVAVRGIQATRALRQVRRQRDVQNPASCLAQLGQRHRRLARTGRAYDHQRRGVPIHGVLRIVEDQGLVQQLE
jgi:hypothetical protein